jgi:structural maintenance of chromosome 3 (chondroitin sulfate proteoglycan 6)
LRSDIDELEGDAGAGVLQSGEVELRETELKNVLASISDLKEQVKGE